MKAILTLIAVGAITVIYTTLAYAVPVELLASSYQIRGDWRYSCDWPDRDPLSPGYYTGSIKKTAVDTPSLGLNVLPSLPQNLTSNDQSSISAEIKKFGIDYYGNGGPNPGGVAGDLSDGTLWSYSDGVFMQIEASWSFRPATSLLSLNLQYSYEDRYAGDTQFVVRLVDKTLPFQLLEYDVPFTYWEPGDANYSFPVNIQHEYELMLYGSGYAGDFTYTELALTADVQSVPEPSTLIFLSLGFVGLAILRKAVKE